MVRTRRFESIEAVRLIPASLASSKNLGMEANQPSPCEAIGRCHAQLHYGWITGNFSIGSLVPCVPVVSYRFHLAANFYV